MKTEKQFGMDITIIEDESISLDAFEIIDVDLDIIENFKNRMESK